MLQGLPGKLQGGVNTDSRCLQPLLFLEHAGNGNCPAVTADGGF